MTTASLRPQALRAYQADSLHLVACHFASRRSAHSARDTVPEVWKEKVDCFVKTGFSVAGLQLLLGTETPGPTDKRHYDDDPLVVFYKQSIIVGAPTDIRAFDKETKTFLWGTLEARGNMELSDGLIHAFGCVPEYQQGLPTGFAYQILMRIDPVNGQIVSKTLLGKRIMFACNDNISFFIVGDVVYVMTYDLLYAFDKHTGDQLGSYVPPLFQYRFRGMTKTARGNILVLLSPSTSDAGAVLVLLDPKIQKETCRFASGRSANWYAFPIVGPSGILYYGEVQDVGYYESYVYAIDEATCKSTWETYLKGDYRLKAVGSYGLYFKLADALVSLDITTGAVRWTQRLGDALANPLIRDWQEVGVAPDGNVYVLTTDLVILDGSTGKELRRYVLNVSPWPIVSNIAMDNDHVAFIAGKNGDGELRVFKAPDLPPLPVVPGSVPNGGVCTEGKDCASGFSSLGPDGVNYCIHERKSCGLKDTDGRSQNETAWHEGVEYRCSNSNVYVLAASSYRSLPYGALTPSEEACQSGYGAFGPEGKMYCVEVSSHCGEPGTPGVRVNARYTFAGLLYECTAPNVVLPVPGQLPYGMETPDEPTCHSGYGALGPDGKLYCVHVSSHCGQLGTPGVRANDTIVFNNRTYTCVGSNKYQ